VRVLFVQVTNKKGVKGRFSSLGLGHLSAVLDKAGIDNKIISCCDEFDLRREMYEYKNDVLALSSVTEFWDTAIDLARAGWDCDKRVIVGGHHISGDQRALHPFMNVGVIGEAEHIIVNILNNKELKGTVGGGLIEDLGSLPHPKRNMGDNHLMTSRGCPYNCSFCSSTKVWRRYRTFPVAWVVDEILEIQRINPDNDWIYVWDDLFAADMGRIAELTCALSHSPQYRQAKFAVHARVETINVATVRAMKQLGVKVVGIGVESGNKRIMKKLKRGKCTPDDVINAIQLLKSNGMGYYCSFILGHPDEKLHELKDTVRFIKKNDIPFFDVNLLTEYPGNEFYGTGLEHDEATVKAYKNLQRLRFVRRVANIYRHPRWN